MKHGFNHGIGPTVFAMMVLVAVPVALGLWFLGKAKRVTSAGRIASTDASFTWHLVESQITAVDSQAVPRATAQP